jgi:hypothetical protein
MCSTVGICRIGMMCSTVSFRNLHRARIVRNQELEEIAANRAAEVWRGYKILAALCAAMGVVIGIYAHIGNVIVKEM